MSLARTGLAVLECDPACPEKGKVTRTLVIPTKPSQPRAQRLKHIYDDTTVFLVGIPTWSASNRITAAYLERPGSWARGKQHSTQATVEALAEARGAVLVALAYDGIACHELTTDEAKCAVAGPRASKETVQKQLRLLGLYDGGDSDIADAVVVALAGARHWWLEHESPLRKRR